MSNSIIKVATTLSLMAFLSLSGEGVVVQKAEAAGAWWKCPSGQYQLEVNSNRNSARCVKPAGRTRVRPDAGCPVGTTFQRDHRGKTDYCLPITGTVGPKAVSSKCGRGQQVERRRGTDRCYVNQSADYRPVSTRN